jgi:hypothetical protein
MNLSYYLCFWIELVSKFMLWNAENSQLLTFVIPFPSGCFSLRDKRIALMEPGGGGGAKQQ